MQFKNKSSDFQVEDSDNDSTNSRSKGNGKNKVTPRRSNGGSTDRLDPIPLVPSSYDEGILSGRRYDNAPVGNGRHSKGGEQREKEVTPRKGHREHRDRDSNYDNNNGDQGGGGYAPVYPSLFNNKGGNSGNEGAGGSGGKRSSAGSANNNNNPPQALQQVPYRRNSKGNIDSEGDMASAQENVYNQFGDLNIGGRGMGRDSGGGNQKAPSGGKNIALGKLKVKGMNSNGSIPVLAAIPDVISPMAVPGGGGNAAANNNNNADFSLNVNGNGVGGGVGAAAAIGVVRPTNKIKPSR